MSISLNSMVHFAEDTEKVVSLFFTYNGATHSVTMNHDALSTPDGIKSTLISAIDVLVDAATVANIL